MTGEAWGIWVTVAVMVLGNWAILSYKLGGMGERVKNHGTWLTSLDSRVLKNEHRMGRIEGRLGVGEDRDGV